MIKAIIQAEEEKRNEISEEITGECQSGFSYY